jgi:folate-dependent phosphoribosylglycinamide formyltransferase PurN
VSRTLARLRLAAVDCGVLASRPHRLAVLASGEGSNFEALALASQRGRLGGPVVLLLCDVPGAQVLARAWQLGVPSVCPPTGRYRTPPEDEAPWLELLRAHQVDAGLDAGPIVAQQALELREGESLATLERRIHEAGRRLYPAAVRRFLGQPWQREGRRVVFADRRGGAARV